MKSESSGWSLRAKKNAPPLGVAVRIRRRRLPALEPGHPGLRDDLVAEPGRQPQQPRRVIDERAVPGSPVAAAAAALGLCRRGAGAEQPAVFPVSAMPMPAAERLSATRREIPPPDWSVSVNVLIGTPFLGRS